MKMNQILFKLIFILCIILVQILATTCQKELAQALVETGPYFGGSISIESYLKSSKKIKDIKVTEA